MVKFKSASENFSFCSSNKSEENSGIKEIGGRGGGLCHIEMFNCCRPILSDFVWVSIKNVMLCELLKDYPLKAQDIKNRDILSPFNEIF